VNPQLCSCPAGTQQNNISTTCTCVQGNTSTYNPATGLCTNNCGIIYCINCTGNTCNTCLPGYNLVGNQCTAFCLIPNCASCSIAGFCNSCNNGLSISTLGDACITCSVSGCLSC